MGIFYFKEALGQNGEIIRVLKFRTMKNGADKSLEDVLENGLDEFGKIIDDSRKTSFGKWLRKNGIDEIPQLFYNVWWKRNMKLAGVRAMKPETWRKYYSKELKERALKYKPGWAGIQYADESKKSTSEKIEIYLDEYEKNPQATDRKYFKKILYNKFFKGVKSS